MASGWRALTSRYCRIIGVALGPAAISTLAVFNARSSYQSGLTRGGSRTGATDGPRERTSHRLTTGAERTRRAGAEGAGCLAESRLSPEEETPDAGMSRRRVRAGGGGSGLRPVPLVERRGGSRPCGGARGGGGPGRARLLLPARAATFIGRAPPGTRAARVDRGRRLCVAGALASRTRGASVRSARPARADRGSGQDAIWLGGGRGGGGVPRP